MELGCVLSQTPQKQRKIHVQVIYLRHAPTEGVGEVARDGEQPKQGRGSQPDAPGHSGGCRTSVCPTHREAALSCTDIGGSGLKETPGPRHCALWAEQSQEPIGRLLMRDTRASHWKHRCGNRNPRICTEDRWFLTQQGFSEMVFVKHLA